MTYKLKASFLGVATMIAVSNLVSVAKADEWNKETIVTFNAPVEVPGKSLPAGTYVFKLADDDSDRNVVQIFTEDQQHLLATVMAVSDSRPEPANRTVITLDERPAGTPEAVRSWFYPGDTEGLEFVYPK